MVRGLGFGKRWSWYILSKITWLSAENEQWKVLAMTAPLLAEKKTRKTK
jgi:hypothetical protein